MIFLDTHVVVWLYAGNVAKLSEAAIEKIENNELFVSQLVRLELQYLFEIGRITVEPDILLKNLKQSIGLKVSPMKVEQVFDLAIACEWTRDVFDRLITAEAEADNVALVTKDERIRANYDKACW